MQNRIATETFTPRQSLWDDIGRWPAVSAASRLRRRVQADGHGIRPAITFRAFSSKFEIPFDKKPNIGAFEFLPELTLGQDRTGSIPSRAGDPPAITGRRLDHSHSQADWWRDLGLRPRSQAILAPGRGLDCSFRRRGETTAAAGRACARAGSKARSRVHRIGRICRMSHPLRRVSRDGTEKPRSASTSGGYRCGLRFCSLFTLSTLGDQRTRRCFRQS
jgi:hypothetical protein